MTTASEDNAGDGGAAHALSERPQLRKPVRAIVAVLELLLATAAVLVAILLWHHGTVRIVYPIKPGQSLVSTRLLGNYAAGAIGLCTLAGLLLLDALRQEVLAMHARRRRKEGRELAAWQEVEAAERTGNVG
ncbi:MAG: hypothetical protein ACRDRN_18945 [Sciscionella sp.]